MHLFCSLIEKTFNHRLIMEFQQLHLYLGEKNKEKKERTTNQTNQELKHLVIPLT